MIRRWQHTWLDNAGARRDFRVQLRGGRAIGLWGAYLLFLGFVVALTYTSGFTEHASIARAQQILHSFYQSTIALLACAVALIAPALGATAIVGERQNRSLELVLAAPIPRDYYIVGKLLSAFRYVWMLLILALPFVSVGVVLGGATWSDVLISFLVIALNGLLWAAMAVAISAGAHKPSSAVAISYASTFAIIVYAFIISEPFSTAGRGGSINHLPITTLLLPFGVAYIPQSVTEIAGHNLPNWLLLIPFIGLLVLLLRFGAASALATRQVSETTWFRSLGLLAVAVQSYFLAKMVSISGDIGPALGWFMLLLTIATPFACCFIRWGVPKFEFDGSPKIRNALRAFPSGGLFYATAIPAAATVGGLVSIAFERKSGAAADLLCYFAWGLGLFVFTGAISRAVSRLSGTLTAARALSVVIIGLLWGAPTLLMTFYSISLNELRDPDIWNTVFSPWTVLGHDRDGLAVAWGAIFLVAALLLNAVVPHLRKSQWSDR